jgi:dTDP-4-amino-4,6-dideoxygalactose transaminase
MTNIQAGFLYDQLNDIDHILSLKTSIIENYNLLLKDLISSRKVIQLKEENETESSKWMYTVIIPTIHYNDLELYMKENNVEIRPFFYDIHDHSHLTSVRNPNNSSFTKTITNHGVILPSYPELTKEEQRHICKCLATFLA